MLTLLTATGCRPEAMRLCQRWMHRQDYAGAVRWIVVDDATQATPVDPPIHWKLEIVRPEPRWKAGQNTQARNLLAGMELVGPEDRVVVVEDDDWYAPDWLTHVAGELDRAELVGECRARYYNVALRRGRQLQNAAHASLCATAMRGQALETFRQACRRAPKFIDLELWRRHPSRHLFDGHRVVGIKGLPGRGGIGMGHRDDFKGQDDRDGRLLRDWVGDDARHYP